LFFIVVVINEKGILSKTKNIFISTNFCILIVLIAYGCIPTVGAIGLIQFLAGVAFKIPSKMLIPILFFLVVTINYVILTKIFLLYNSVVNFLKKYIKLINLIYFIGLFLIGIFIVWKSGSFLESGNPNLYGFDFPAPYFNPISRSLNVLILLIIVVPFISISYTLIQKLRNNLDFNIYDFLYLLAIIIILIFFAFFYLIFGLNGLFLRGAQLISLFAFSFSGFLFYNPSLFRKIYSKENSTESDNLIQISQNTYSCLEKKTDKSILSLIIFQICIYSIYYFNQKYQFLYDYFGSIMYSLYFFLIPGLLLIKILNVQVSEYETIIHSIFSSFIMLTINFIVLNSLSLFSQDNIMLIPILTIIFIYIIKLLYLSVNINKSFNLIGELKLMNKSFDIYLIFSGFIFSLILSFYIRIFIIILILYIGIKYIIIYMQKQVQNQQIMGDSI
jgi:hypothetical protein